MNKSVRQSQSPVAVPNCKPAALLRLQITVNTTVRQDTYIQFGQMRQGMHSEDAKDSLRETFWPNCGETQFRCCPIALSTKQFLLAHLTCLLFNLLLNTSVPTSSLLRFTEATSSLNTTTFSTPPHGCMPPPTSHVAVYIRGCPKQCSLHFILLEICVKLSEFACEFLSYG